MKSYVISGMESAAARDWRRIERRRELRFWRIMLISVGLVSVTVYGLLEPAFREASDRAAKAEAVLVQAQRAVSK